jgi:hypothetical protein
MLHSSVDRSAGTGDVPWGKVFIRYLNLAVIGKFTNTRTAVNFPNRQIQISYLPEEQIRWEKTAVSFVYEFAKYLMFKQIDGHKKSPISY